ncbi:hypothetical protein SPRG_17706, partial [Saprolegnia parasitica CBS 223.65]
PKHAGAQSCGGHRLGRSPAHRRARYHCDLFLVDVVCRARDGWDPERLCHETGADLHDMPRRERSHVACRRRQRRLGRHDPRLHDDVCDDQQLARLACLGLP